MDRGVWVIKAQYREVDDGKKWFPPETNYYI
jgi:hypothetical protein